MNVTVVRITARALIGRRRFLFLLPLPLILIGLSVLSSSLGADPDDWVRAVAIGLGVDVLLPVIALVIGTGVLGSEIDDGTLAHILAKPISRAQIIISKLAVAIVVTAVTVCVPMFIVGLIGGSTALAWGLALGGLLGSVAYCSLFVLLSLLTRRPVIVGLLYVLIWEGLLGNLLSGTKVLAVQQYVIALADKVADSPYFSGDISLAVSFAMAFILSAGATLLAIDRLRSFSVVGETS